MYYSNRRKGLVRSAYLLLLVLVLGSLAYICFKETFAKYLFDNCRYDFIPKQIRSRTIDIYRLQISKLFFSYYLYAVFCLLLYFIIELSIKKTRRIGERLYSSIVTICETCIRHQRIFLFVVCVISAVITSGVAHYVLHNFPNSADEYAYIFQAKLYLHGKLYIAAHPLQQFFNFYRICSKNGIVFSQYPFGWPAVLALFQYFKVPFLFVNPIIGACSLMALYLVGRRFYDDRTAVVSTVVMGISPFFIFNSASYFSHTLNSLQILLVVYFGLSFIDKGKVIDAFFSGLIFSWAVMTRPYTAFLCALPLAAYFFYNKCKYLKKIAWVAIGAAPIIAYILFQNYFFTANPFKMPETPGSGYAYPFVRNLIQLNYNIIFMFIDFVLLLKWTAPFLPLLYIVYFIAYSRSKEKEDVIGRVLFALAVGYAFVKFNAGNRYGPRYYYEGFPFLVLFVVSKLFRQGTYHEKGHSDKAFFISFCLSVALMPLLLVSHAIQEEKIVWERMEPYRLVEKNKINNAIVFIKTGSGNISPMSLYDLTRNEPDFSNTVLYAKNRNNKNKTLMRYYPDKEYYQYYYDRKMGCGYLKRLEPVMEYNKSIE